MAPPQYFHLFIRLKTLMKSLKILVLCFWVASCQNDKTRLEAHSVPQIFTLKSLPNITYINDIVLLDSKKYNGFLYQLSPDGKDTLSMEGYSNGMLHGICRKWFPNKQLMEERHYSINKKHGNQMAYWENGNKRFEFIALNDAYEGELREWSFEGHLVHLANYVNGQEEGTQKLWYDNGKIRANYVIVQGKRYGLLGTKNCKNVSDSIFVVQ